MGDETYRECVHSQNNRRVWGSWELKLHAAIFLYILQRGKLLNGVARCSPNIQLYGVYANERKYTADGRISLAVTRSQSVWRSGYQETRPCARFMFSMNLRGCKNPLQIEGWRSKCVINLLYQETHDAGGTYTQLTDHEHLMNTEKAERLRMVSHRGL